MEPLKHAFSPELVGLIATHVARHLDGFDPQAFTESVAPRLPDLELKERSQLIADRLHAALPQDLTRRFAIIRAMLHPAENAGVLDQSDDRGLRGWAILPLTALVGQHGLPAFDASLDLLKEMTSRFSAEFDVRHFLLADQDRALARIQAWVSDPNRHVRRLVSEGTRPRLPWAMRLPSLVADPTPLLPLLESLRDDPEDYVRRSVANSLNDIAKDHPGLVADLTEDWLRNAPPARVKLLRHACRSLIKAGHPRVLAAFGIKAPSVEARNLSITRPSIMLGETLDFSVTLRSTSPNDQRILIDYVLHFRRANGTLSAKVFKWKELDLPAQQTIALSRGHPIRPITTRRYYAGAQALSLRINGHDTDQLGFQLQI
jgi:3-methyladenine DNA glycosylase AlkC